MNIFTNPAKEAYKAAKKADYAYIAAATTRTSYNTVFVISDADQCAIDYIRKCADAGKDFNGVLEAARKIYNDHKITNGIIINQMPMYCQIYEIYYSNHKAAAYTRDFATAKNISDDAYNAAIKAGGKSTDAKDAYNAAFFNTLSGAFENTLTGIAINRGTYTKLDAHAPVSHWITN